MRCHATLESAGCEVHGYDVLRISVKVGDHGLRTGEIVA
jgi:hypothetical protein